MGSPYSENNRRDASATSSGITTGTSASYDEENDSFSLSSTSTPGRRSPFDSYHSTDSTNSGRRQRSGPRSVRRRLSKPGPTLSERSRSPASGSSVKSILKKRAPVKGKRPLTRSMALPLIEKRNERPMGELSLIKNENIREQLRLFVSEYAKDPDFEAFSISVDGIPFVALSLINAEPALYHKFKKAQPPTPMKRHTPGTNSPRKRHICRGSSSRRSSANSKCVRFTDEDSSPKRARKSPPPEDERDFCGTVSDAMNENDRQYNDLWDDRSSNGEK